MAFATGGRSGATPMEYEYDNKRGPVDINSPWLGASQRNNSYGFGSQNQPSSQAQSSPFRSTEPHKPAPQTPLRSPLPQAFSQIREANFDFSSGAENPSSPENADNEDTPDVQRILDKNVTVFRGNKSPSKATRSPLRESISNISNWFTKRMESPPRPQAGPVVRKAHKRKRRDGEKRGQLSRRRGSEDTEDDANSPNRPSQQNKPIQEVGKIPAILAFMHNHPNLPHILAWYVQLIMNCFFALFTMYAIYMCWATIRQDVNTKADEAAAEIMEEIAKCASQYLANQCAENRLPALKAPCLEWESCMNRDPKAIARSKISAHTFAEIFNSFVEPLGFKVIFVVLATMISLSVLPRFLFSYIKNKDEPSFPYQYQQPQYMPTPSFAQSPYGSQQQQYFNEQYFTPQRQRTYDMLDHPDMNGGRESPGKRDKLLDSPSKRNRDGRDSPTKRIGYH